MLERVLLEPMVAVDEKRRVLLARLYRTSPSSCQSMSGGRSEA